MKLLLRARRGFTLIELLIVIVIIGILSVGLIPKVLDAPKRARDTTRKADIGNIKVALESYYADKNSYPDTSKFSDLKDYFQGKTTPVDPADKSAYGYILVPAGCYALSAKLEVKVGNNSDTDASKATTCTAPKATKADHEFFVVVGGN